MVLKPFHVLKKRVWLEEIVVIEESHPITRRERETTIRGGRNSAFFFVLGQNDPRVRRRQLGQGSKRCGLSGIVIDENQLPFFVSLGQHRLDAFPQPSDRRVKDGCDDTDEWLERESKRLLPHSLQVACVGPVALQ